MTVPDLPDPANVTDLPGPADAAELPDAAAAVREHLAAFNAHSTQRLLDGLAHDAVWSTGADVFDGSAALADLFDPWLWTLEPSLTLHRMVADGDHVAVQLVEQLTVDGETRRMDIAVFFEVSAGKIVAAKVYREGSADLD